MHRSAEAMRAAGVQVEHVPRVLGAEEVRALQALVPRMPVTDAAVELAVALGRATRPHDPKAPREARELVRFGSGPRGPQALVLASKARAALRGEAAADVDDVKALVLPVLRHRLVLSYRAEAEGVKDVDVLERVVASVG